MATITPYDQASWASYSPLSFQEKLAPLMSLRQRHDQVDEELAAVDNELQKVAVIAQAEKDENITNQYNAYMNELASVRDALINNGVDSNTKRSALGLKAKYQSSIQPISAAYQMRAKAIEERNQLLAKDQTYIGEDPASRRLGDYINNGLTPFTNRGVSGAMLTKQAEDYLRPFSQELNGEPQLRAVLQTLVGDEYIPQYMDYIKNYGYKPGTKGHQALMELVQHKVLTANGISDWATPEQIESAKSFIDLASSSTIGKDQAQLVNNNNVVIAQQKLEQKRAEEAAKATPTNDLGILWTSNPRNAVSMNFQAQEDQIKNLERSLANEATDLDKKRTAVKNMVAKGSYQDKITDLINKFEDGEINEKDFRSSIEKVRNSLGPKNLLRQAKEGIFGTEIDDYLKEHKKDITKDYKEWAKANPGGSKEDYLRDYQEDLQVKSTYINNPYLSNNTSVQSFQDNLFGNYLNNIANSNALIIDEDGDKVDLKDDKDLMSIIRDTSKTKNSGINLYNPETNSPTMDYSTVDKDGKTYNVSIPISRNSNEYTIIKPYADLLKEINKPYKPNRKIRAGNNEYTLKKGRSDQGAIIYYVEDEGGNQLTLPRLQQIVQEQLDSYWVASSQPISKF